MTESAFHRPTTDTKGTPMKLTRRLARLENRQQETADKRAYLALEHLALRTAFIELAALISTSSAAQYVAAKGRAMHSLTNQLLEGGFSEQAAAEATTSLEELFCEIDVAQTEADQPAPSIS